MSSLDIVIVNWNSGTQLTDCLDSILKVNLTKIEIKRVVVVDNASSDNSVDSLFFPGLPLYIIRNEENRGFAVACNQGAKGSHSDYLLFLNPDTQLFIDSMQKSVEFMEQPKNIKVGVCGLKLVDKNGNPVTSCANFPTPMVFLGKATGLSKVFPKVFPKHFLTHDDLKVSREVDQVIGAFFLVRRKVFGELDGFDERFFVYFEEVDFSLRAKLAGYSSYYLSDACVYHKGGGTSENIKSTRLFYSLRSRIQYGFKHFSTSERVFLLVITVVLEFVIRCLFSLLKFSLSQLIETLGGYRKLSVYLIKEASHDDCR